MKIYSLPKKMKKKKERGTTLHVNARNAVHKATSPIVTYPTLAPPGAEAIAAFDEGVPDVAVPPLPLIVLVGPAPAAVVVVGVGAVKEFR